MALILIKNLNKNDKYGNKIWLCQCSCGKLSKHVGYQVRNGNIKSCGCKRKGRKYGHGKLTGKRMLYSTYKHGAKVRKIIFKLSFKYFVKIISQNCLYCNSEPEIRIRHRYTFLSNGIDREDSKKGYVRGNVIPCCKICNKAKNDLSPQVFRLWAEKIANNINNWDVDYTFNLQNKLTMDVTGTKVEKE